jgi:4-oxalocrotonate tautomerase
MFKVIQPDAYVVSHAVAVRDPKHRIYDIDPCFLNVASILHLLTRADKVMSNATIIMHTIPCESLLHSVKPHARKWSDRNFKPRKTMPLARIDISDKATSAVVRVVSDSIYKAMVEVANVPVHDKFQVVTRHSSDEIIYPSEGYLGIQYTPDLVVIQVTWVSGRSTEVKKNFFQQIASEIHEKGGIRKEDVWISLIESGREDWSFGNGEMQYGPK